MGDIADEHYDRMVDEGHYWGRRQLSPRCNRCGVACWWAERQGKWTLYQGPAPHVCATTGVKATDFAVAAEDRG